jgi:hypothetical protein
VTQLPDSLNRFQAELEGAIARDLGRRRRRARVLRPLAAAAVLGVGGALAGPLLLAGGGPSIVNRAEAALTAGSGEFLHIRMLGRTTTPGGQVVEWKDEEWIVSGSIAPRRSIQTGPTDAASRRRRPRGGGSSSSTTPGRTRSTPSRR